MVKHYLMVQLWRVQQSYSLLSLLIWGVLITFTSWTVLKDVWADFLGRFGIQLSAPGAVAAGLLVIFLAVYAILFAFGVVYDKYLKLWRAQRHVSHERKPYHPGELMVEENLMWE